MYTLIFQTAEKIYRTVFFGEWRLANLLAYLPVLDYVVEALIEKGLLTPPADGIGAEGCRMSVEN